MRRCGSRPRSSRSGANASAACASPGGVGLTGDPGGERPYLVGCRRFVSDQRAEHLAGVLEHDPREQLDRLGDRQLVEEDRDLGVADRGVVGGHGVREGDGEGLLRIVVLSRGAAERCAVRAARVLRERPSHLLLEVRGERRGRPGERLPEAVPRVEQLGTVAEDAVGGRGAEAGRRYARQISLPDRLTCAVTGSAGA